MKHKERDKMDAKYLTIKDICELLQVSRATVNRWIQSRKLRSKKIGRLVRVKEMDLVRFADGWPHRAARKAPAGPSK